jgi:hypothetical protein
MEKSRAEHLGHAQTSLRHMQWLLTEGKVSADQETRLRANIAGTERLIERLRDQMGDDDQDDDSRRREREIATAWRTHRQQMQQEQVT